jgi:hypothetical protein
VGAGVRWVPTPWVQLAARWDTRGEGKAVVTVRAAPVRLLAWLLPRAPPPGTSTPTPAVAVLDYALTQQQAATATLEVVHCPALGGHAPTVGALVYETHHAAVVARPGPRRALSAVTARVRVPPHPRVPARGLADAERGHNAGPAGQLRLRVATDGRTAAVAEVALPEARLTLGARLMHVRSTGAVLWGIELTSDA